MRCFLDCETTGTNVLNDEIIEAYFKVVHYGFELETYHLKSQVAKWSCEAEKIHGISETTMLGYPEKKVALGGLNDFLKSLDGDTVFICFANPNNMGEFYYFDKSIIEAQFIYNEFDFRFPNINISKFISVYDMAKDAYKKKLFIPVKNPETNRISFSQENVYLALFEESYDSAHNAKSDVESLERIYVELNDMLRYNRPNRSIKQLGLI